MVVIVAVCRPRLIHWIAARCVCCNILRWWSRTAVRALFIAVTEKATVGSSKCIFCVPSSKPFEKTGMLCTTFASPPRTQVNRLTGPGKKRRQALPPTPLRPALLTFGSEHIAKSSDASRSNQMLHSSSTPAKILWTQTLAEPAKNESLTTFHGFDCKEKTNGN